MTDEGVRLGGNVSGVRRRGDVVTRLAGPWTPTIHSLLTRLLSAGLLVPQPFGVEGDREVLRFVVGEVPAEPYPPEVWSDPSLIGVARLLRRLHDATEGFVREGQSWRLPACDPAEVVCHNDLAPYNTLFRDGFPAGAIDFDTAAPGPRIRDIAYVAYRWVPLQAPGHGSGPTDPGERVRRLALLLTAYGSGASPGDVIATALERVRELRAFTAERRAFVNAHLASYDADIAYLQQLRIEP